MTSSSLLRLGAQWQKRSTSPELDAEVLLAYVCGESRAHLTGHPKRPIPWVKSIQFLYLCWRASLGIPIAYLTHQREFYGRIFNVTRATLVPRPETEVLVEEALRVLRANHNLTNIVDLGTGSGCIAITLSLELPNRTVTATDESAAALAVAQHNAQRLGAEHIHFLHGSLLQPLRALLSSDFGQHTVLVANLPYLSPNEYRGNLRFEPRSALVSGHDGLNLYRQLFQELSALPESRRPSYVVLELHAPQADTLIELTKNTFQQCDVQVTPDLAALPRVLTIRLA